MARSPKPADTPEDLAAQVSALRDELRALHDSVAQLAAAQKGGLGDDLAAGLGALGAKGREGVEAAQSEIDRLLAEATAYARDKPMKALGIAAMAGMVLGLLFGRR
jgi:ElaB/YqjD/DUF883 family membrane-anchored ribosome-binding protein